MVHNAIPKTDINARGCLAVLAMVAAVTGCSDDPVSLGGAVAVDRSALISYAAVWEGYVEAHTFASGSDKVRLVLDESGQGSLTFGEGTPPPMPTDPAEPFPQLAAEELSRFFDQVFEGFPYAIHAAEIEAERLRARTEPSNVYQAAACALQTPIDRGEVPPGDARYTCLESSGYTVVEGRCYVSDPTVPYEEQPSDDEISCRQWEVCATCACDATSCMALSEGAPFTIDGVLDASGMRLEASMRSPFGSHVLRLTREP